MIRNSEEYSWLVSVISYHRYIERAHAGVISDFTFDLSVRTERQSGFNTRRTGGVLHRLQTSSPRRRTHQPQERKDCGQHKILAERDKY